MTSTQPDATTVIESHPTIRPTIVQMVVLVLVGMALILYLRANPRLLGEVERTQITIVVIMLLVLLGLVRLLIRAIVLTKTTYTVTDERVTKQYELLYRREHTEVPFDLVRSHEFSQNRIESILGYGTVRLNQGLGTLTLANVEHPHELNEAIRSRLS